MKSTSFNLDTWRTLKFYSNDLLYNNEIIEITASITKVASEHNRTTEKEKIWEIKLYPKTTTLENAGKQKNTEAYIPLAVKVIILSLIVWSQKNSIVDSWKNESEKSK